MANRWQILAFWQTSVQDHRHQEVPELAVNRLTVVPLRVDAHRASPLSFLGVIPNYNTTTRTKNSLESASYEIARPSCQLLYMTTTPSHRRRQPKQGARELLQTAERAMVPG